jgi:hypothetical protein
MRDIACLRFVCSIMCFVEFFGKFTNYAVFGRKTTLENIS